MSNAHEDTSYDHTVLNRTLMGNVVRLPVKIDQAVGSRVHDAESDRWMLDFWGDEGVASLGYGDAFIDALRDFQYLGLPHRLPDVYPNETRWAAAEKIASSAGYNKLFFSNSGTEANEAAIKLARKYWWDRDPGKSSRNYSPRHIIYTVAGNFHGRTGFALAACDFRVSPYHRHGFGPEAPGFGVIDLIDGEWRVVAMDGREFDETEEPDWANTAAIIMAPVLGNNCVKTYSPDFWEALSNARKQHGVLIIYDDVQAGNGRAGHYATWQHPGCNVKPDIMTLSKGIALGMPMSVMLADESIAKSFTPGVHFNTFGGTILCCHLALKLYAYLDDHLPEIQMKGEFIRDEFRLRSYLKHYDGWGMLNAFQPDFEQFGYNGFQFIAEARKQGLLLCTHRATGMIRFTPPLNVSRHDVQEALNILDNTHARLAAGG